MTRIIELAITKLGSRSRVTRRLVEATGSIAYRSL
jgi:hypothetical protein